MGTEVLPPSPVLMHLQSPSHCRGLFPLPNIPTLPLGHQMGGTLCYLCTAAVCWSLIQPQPTDATSLDQCEMSMSSSREWFSYEPDFSRDMRNGQAQHSPAGARCPLSHTVPCPAASPQCCWKRARHTMGCWWPLIPSSRRLLLPSDQPANLLMVSSLPLRRS